MDNLEDFLRKNTETIGDRFIIQIKNDLKDGGLEISIRNVNSHVSKNFIIKDSPFPNLNPYSPTDQWIITQPPQHRKIFWGGEYMANDFENIKRNDKLLK